MDSDLRQRAEELFEAAVEIPPDGRDAFVVRAAAGDARLEAEVRALLRAHERSGVLERTLPPPPEPGPRHERIGQYRVVGTLGRGGMGVVYAAERDDGQFRRRVAIKVLRADADPSLEARVIAERQILASLDHPSIAKLLDGGLTPDGRPFLVMEHVDGLPIDVYADRMRLTMAERLRLFVTVARAVEHAHRNLVVHRDLKPSNMLVTSRGEVKLLDFGIAKLLNPSLGAASPYTVSDFGALTPEYASPEQVRAEPLSTVTDVYSLGVILFRLLTGRHPYDLSNRSMESIVEVVCRRDPPRPSDVAGQPPDHPAGAASAADLAAARRSTPDRLARSLRGDLDAIVLKALRKEPSDRYGSAELLAQDIERHLDGLPIQARRGTAAYRLRKFARRHRWQAAAAVIVLVSLLGGAGAAGWQARVAGVERDRAADALLQSEAVTDFLLGLFAVADPDGARPEEITAADLLRRGLARVERLSGEPLVQARMLEVVAKVHMQLGQYEDAIAQFRRALDGRVGALGERHPESALAMVELAVALRNRARYDEARSLLDRARSIQRETLGPRHPAVATTLDHLAYIEFDLNRREVLLREALAIREAALPPDHLEISGTRILLATAARGLGRYDEALALLRDAHASRIRHFGTDDRPEVTEPMFHIGDILYEHRDQPAEAERVFRRALDVRERHLGRDDLSLIHGLHSLGDLLGRQGRWAEADSLLRRSVAILTGVFGAQHPRTIEATLHYAAGLQKRGDHASAAAIYRRAVTAWESTFSPRHPSVANARAALASALLELGRLDEAESELRLALSIRQESLGARSIMIGLTLTDLGDVARRRGDLAAARRTYEEGRAILLEHLPPTHPQVKDLDIRLESLDLVRSAGPSSAGPGG